MILATGATRTSSYTSTKITGDASRCWWSGGCGCGCGRRESTESGIVRDCHAGCRRITDNAICGGTDVVRMMGTMCYVESPGDHGFVNCLGVRVCSGRIEASSDICCVIGRRSAGHDLSIFRNGVGDEGSEERTTLIPGPLSLHCTRHSSPARRGVGDIILLSCNMTVT